MATKRAAKAPAPPVGLNRTEGLFLNVDCDLTDLAELMDSNGVPQRYVAAVEQARDQLRKVLWKLPAWAGRIHTPPLPPCGVE